jgi:hypothetical protein
MSGEIGTRRRPISGRGLPAVWSGVLGAPLIFLVHLQAGYALVPLACRLQSGLLTHGPTALAVLLTASAAFVSHRSWKRNGYEWPDSSASPQTSNRFLGALGVMVSVFVIIALVAQWLPIAFVNPCSQAQG